MVEVKKKIKQAINVAQTSYMANLIAYARVDNNYTKRQYSFDLFPHPAMREIMPQMKPFANRKKIVLDKKEIILLLSSLHIISPAQIEDTFDYLAYYLNEDLLPKDDEKKAEIEKVISIFEQEKKKRGMRDKDIIQANLNIHEEFRGNNEEAELFIVENVDIISMSDTKELSRLHWVREKNRTADRSSPHGGAIPVKSMGEAIIHFRKNEEDKKLRGEINVKNKNK